LKATEDMKMCQSFLTSVLQIFNKLTTVEDEKENLPVALDFGGPDDSSGSSCDGSSGRCGRGGCHGRQGRRRGRGGLLHDLVRRFEQTLSGQP